MQKTYCYTFEVRGEAAEILMAHLSMLDFYAFEETENEIKAYSNDENMKDALEGLSVQIPLDYRMEELPYQNWNAVWESNFETVVVDDFCGIRATFHEPIPDVEHEIVIMPKMAFGTGHHETTFMMIQAMKNIDFADKKVFDYGCGTGILAVLASFLGAKVIDAVDIEIESYENTIEHADLNQVHNINAIHGVLSDVAGDGYDIILANINRNVILDSLSSLYHKLEKGGHILFSGVLLKDEAHVVEQAQKNGFVLLSKNNKGDWSCLHMTK